MKKITLTMILTLIYSGSFAFENKQLNDLYEKLQHYSEAKVQSKAATVIYLVGAGGGACQYGLIRDAINAANLTGDAHNYEIRVANNKTYTENLLINRVNLSLKGGYANCADANNDIQSGDKTKLDASGQALPAIIIRNYTTTKHYNDIYNFDISGGVNIGFSPSGGINVRDDYIEVNIENSIIFNNVGTQGGGVFIEGASSAVYIKDTFLIANDATNGGGLYCDAADVYVYGDSGISANNAIGTSFDGSGGGIYLTNNCNFNVFSGTTGGFFDFRGIAGNTANRDGGGIYAENGAQVLLIGYLFIGEFGNNDQPVNITSNKANNSATTRSGGGIYATGANTNISAYATIINNNETMPGITSSAGGVYLFQADFSIGKLGSACWNQQKCNQIIANISGSSNPGIMALTGSTVDIKNTWISGHASANNVFLYGQVINAVIEGNVFTDNGGASVDGNTSLLSFHGDAGNLSVAYNTFVNNELNDSLFLINNTPTLLVHGNIIQESNNVDILQVASGSAINTQFRCSIVHENQSFSGSSIFVDDPEFVDAANEDFHISSTSPAIDLCGDNPYLSSTKDLDDEDRGWDDLFTDNVDGAKDAGVDEFYPATTADLSVSKILLTQAPYFVNDLVNYEITVNNNGPDAASSVQVEESPFGLTIIDVQGPNCSSFPCVIASLSNLSGQVINVTARLRSTEGLFDNSVSVYSQDYDPDDSNNTDNTGNSGTAIVDNVDMVVNFSLTTVGPYHSGQIVTYQASVTNTGPDTARNVVISSNILMNTQLLNTVGAPCVQLPCNLASFASGATVNLTLSVKIITGGSFRFGINTVTDSTDTDLNNNAGTVLNLIAQNTGDIEITAQLVTAPTYTQGQSVEITMLVANNGPDMIGSIGVSAVLTNLNISSVSGAGCNSLPCESLVLASGDDLTITVFATILNSGDFGMATSAISNNSYDSYLANNDSSFIENAAVDSDIIFADSFE